MKKLIATATAVALASGLCAPAAHAAYVTGNGSGCDIVYSKQEGQLIGKYTSTKTRYQAELWLEDQKTILRDGREVSFKKLEEKFKRGELDESLYQRDKKRLNARFVYSEQFTKLHEGCLSGELVKVRIGNAKPADPSPAPALSTDEELEPTDIGLIVVGALVLGGAVVAALLPQIKPMLPPEIQALLP